MATITRTAEFTPVYDGPAAELRAAADEAILRIKPVVRRPKNDETSIEKRLYIPGEEETVVQVFKKSSPQKRWRRQIPAQLVVDVAWFRGDSGFIVHDRYRLQSDDTLRYLSWTAITSAIGSLKENSISIYTDKTINDPEEVQRVSADAAERVSQARYPIELREAGLWLPDYDREKAITTYMTGTVYGEVHRLAEQMS